MGAPRWRPFRPWARLPAAEPDPPPLYPGLGEVSNTQVVLCGGFWGPRLETHRRTTIPHALDCLEKDGHVTNFDKAAGKLKGPASGHAAFDSEPGQGPRARPIVCNTSGDGCGPDADASQLLAAVESPSAGVKGIIERIRPAQQKDGYLISYFILQPQSQPWSYLPADAPDVQLRPLLRNGRPVALADRQPAIARRRPGSRRQSRPHVRAGQAVRRRRP